MADQTTSHVLFGREDISKPENRANVWLLACLAIEDFRSRLLTLLGLPADSVLKPVQWNGIRPDLTIMIDDVPHYVIECENAGLDPQQGPNYERNLPIPIKWIVGHSPQPGDVAWKDIADLSSIVREAATPQQATCIDLLAHAINDILSRRSTPKPRWVEPPEELNSEPWFHTIFGPLLALRPTSITGMIAYTASGRSASLRLLRPAWAMRTRNRFGVGLATFRGSQRNIVEFPGPEHLRRCLSMELHQRVADWEQLLARVLPNWWASTGQSGRAQVDTRLASVNAREFGASFEKLATLVLQRQPVVGR